MKQPLSTKKEWFESAGCSSSSSITLMRCSSPGFGVMCWESADCNCCVCQTAGCLGGCVCSPLGKAGIGIDQSDTESLSRLGTGAVLLWTAVGDFVSVPSCLLPAWKKLMPLKDGTWGLLKQSQVRFGIVKTAFQYLSVKAYLGAVFSTLR